MGLSCLVDGWGCGLLNGLLIYFDVTPFVKKTLWLMVFMANPGALPQCAIGSNEKTACGRASFQRVQNAREPVPNFFLTAGDCQWLKTE
jgi:hypothetical protein